MVTGSRILAVWRRQPLWFAGGCANDRRGEKRLCGKFEPLSSEPGALAPLMIKASSWPGSGAAKRAVTRCYRYRPSGQRRQRAGVGTTLHKGYRLPEPTRWADAVASERPRSCAIQQISPNSGKLRIISDLRTQHVTKPNSSASGAPGKWQHVTFMACLCERMYPNYAVSVSKLVLVMGKFTAVFSISLGNADRQRRKSKFRQPTGEIEEAIPSADDFDLYGVYPAIEPAWR